MISIPNPKPLVYSCSGCSGSAQMANYLAVKLDRLGKAEMSCIAGIGGHIKTLLDTAESGRKIIAIDGCPLSCTRVCLLQHSLMPDLHIELSGLGVPHAMHENYDLQQANHIYTNIESKVMALELLNSISLTDLSEPASALLHLTVGPEPALSPDSETITIIEVKDRAQMRAFIELPYQLYKNHPFYVPHLKSETAESFDPQKNPSLAFCEVRFWLAYKNNRVAGRIAGIINHAYIEKWNNRYMRFGWIDFEEDENIAHALLHEVENWATEKKMTAVHGPLGFTNFDYAGTLVAGYDQPGTYATIYNYPYYPPYIESSGYRKDIDWVEYKIKTPESIPEKMKLAALVVEKRYKLRVVKFQRTRDILPYGKAIFGLLNSAYENLYGIVALNDQQIEYHTRKFLKYIRPGFISMVVDEKENMAAVGITIPSLSHAMQKANGSLFPLGFIYLYKALKKNNLADLCLVAIRKDLQGKGVNAILMKEMVATYIRNNIRYAESNPELETNSKVQSIWKHFEAIQHKRRRCYIKFLD